MKLKPWREVAIPHEDVLKGTFQQAEFAADISRVHAGTADAAYQDPVSFFERTFITEGMRLLLDSVVRRLAGVGGEPVIQLQTAFGGGKTHTMLAVYHLARGQVAASELAGVPPILDAAGVSGALRARVAVLDGIKSSPSQPTVRDGQPIRTLWGDLAWQLGGVEGYQLVADADASGTSPGKAVLQELLERAAPAVILIDELVAYIRQFEEGVTLPGGSFDSNLSFVQALTEAIKAVPNAVLLASLPESEKEAGSQRGVKALASLSHYFGRVQALWKPVASEEAFEIVRRRLFSDIADEAAMQATCRAFADHYIANRDDFPQETQEAKYLHRLTRAYPIHPEVFDRLYEDWSTLDNFQRTRGVLKLMAKVIHRLWKDGNNDLVIMPGSLPLYDVDVRNESIYYLPQGWDPVIERDVDGERAETTEIESRDTRFGSVQACRRAARTIFLGSAPSTAHQMVRGLEVERIMLGSVQPDQAVSVFRDALNRLGDRLHYLNYANNRYWLDTRPNLRREMEERKRRFHDREDVFPIIHDLVRRGVSGAIFGGVHVFTPSGDVPDDLALRLVVLPPDTGFSKSSASQAQARATEILKTRGEQPRFRQNRLLFLAPDADTISRLQDHVRTYLAWQSIVRDYQDNRIVLDNLMARQAAESLKKAEDTVHRMARETYKWLLAPIQHAEPGRALSEILWEAYPLNPSAPGWAQEVERVVRENEIVIADWAPIHLSRMLKAWFWREDAVCTSALNAWEQTCRQLYLPRLQDVSVYRKTLEAGAERAEFFGFAQGMEDGRYAGFSYHQPTTLFLDSALLLIEPGAAAAWAQKLRDEREELAPAGTDALSGDGAIPPAQQPETGGLKPLPPGAHQPPGEQVSAAGARRFYGSVALDPIQAKAQFNKLVDEVLQQFTIDPNATVALSIELHVQTSAAFDRHQQRTVKENCNVLGFRSAEFED